MRRIIAKAMLSVVKLDILEAAGSLQLCAGQDAGNEAAVHAMRAIYCDAATEAVLLVDASNAFDCLNRQVSLHNMQALCPPLLLFLLTPIDRTFLCLLMGSTSSHLRGLHRVIPWRWRCIPLALLL